MFLIYIFQTKTKSDFGVSQNPICLRSESTPRGVLFFFVSVFAEGLVDRLLVCLGTEEDDEVEDHIDDQELRQHVFHDAEQSIAVAAEEAGTDDGDEGQGEVDGGGAGERETVVIHDGRVDADEERRDEPDDEFSHGGSGGAREEQGQGGDDGPDAGAHQTEVDIVIQCFHSVISLRIL